MIEGERGSRTLRDVAADEDEPAIAAVTVAELLVSIHLAPRSRREARERALTSILGSVEIEPYDVEVARAHASLLAHTRRTGRTRGVFDLIIAATALARERIIITADMAGFADLPGVRVRS